MIKSKAGQQVVSTSRVPDDVLPSHDLSDFQALILEGEISF